MARKTTPTNACPVCKMPAKKMKNWAVFTAGTRTLHALNKPVILPGQRRRIHTACLRTIAIAKHEPRV